MTTSPIGQPGAAGTPSIRPAAPSTLGEATQAVVEAAPAPVRDLLEAGMAFAADLTGLAGLRLDGADPAADQAALALLRAHGPDGLTREQLGQVKDRIAASDDQAFQAEAINRLYAPTVPLTASSAISAREVEVAPGVARLEIAASPADGNQVTIADVDIANGPRMATVTESITERRFLGGQAGHEEVQRSVQRGITTDVGEDGRPVTSRTGTEDVTVRRGVDWTRTMTQTAPDGTARTAESSHRSGMMAHQASDLPGLGLYGETPQSLLDRFGGLDQVAMDETIERGLDGAERSVRRFYTPKTGDVRQELIAYGKEGEGQVYELREYKGTAPDGQPLVDTQTFFMGYPDDTSVTRTSTVPGTDWVLRTTDQRFDELRKQEGNEGLPATRAIEEREKVGATQVEVEAALMVHPQFQALAGTDTFERFLAAARAGSPDGPPAFDVIMTRVADDGGAPSYQMTVRSGTATIAMMSEPPSTAATFRDGEASSDVYLGPDGTEMKKVEGPSLFGQALGGAATWGGRGKDVGLVGIEAAERTANLLRGAGFEVAENSAAGRFLGKMGGLALAVGAVSAADAIRRGEYLAGAQGAAQTAGELGVMAQGLAQAGDTGYVATTLGAGKGLATLRALGAVGVGLAVTQAGIDTYNGKYGRAALGTASAATTAYSLLYGAAALGPIGWTVAGASTAGLVIYDHGDSTEIADARI